MAYYKASKVIKMRREAMGHDRYEYEVEGPSFMTVYRLEEGKVRVKENTYRSLSRAMGEEESTRQGIIKTKDIKELWIVNKISNAFLENNYIKVEELIRELEERIDCNEKRNQSYLEYVNAKLQYRKGRITAEEYENILRSNISYGKMSFEYMIENIWPFHETEWRMILGIESLAQKKQNYEKQQILLVQLQRILETGYMEMEYSMAYWACIRWQLSDVFGNMGHHREAIALDEETIRQCEVKKEFRYLAELYYDIFWNYKELKKKETLIKQEETRCKECLLKAYYINKTRLQPKMLYERKLREHYPEEL